MKVITMANGRKMYTWIDVRKSLLRKWWIVEVRNHYVGADPPGLMDVCIAKFANKDDAEKYAKEQRKRRGY